ncbi:MAG: hypothetical protein KAR42_16690 [candidate division Zixibacteria bacterium]|nr:hypothetical protein [candidate division Zixibacteria bacterium]
MSLVNLDYKFKNLKGEIVKEKVALVDENENQIVSEFGVPQFELKDDFTLRKIIEDTLFNPAMIQDQRTGQLRQITEQKKKACYKLLNKILGHKKGPIDLESEEITLLKDLIRKKFNSPWTSGQACDVLDPAEAAENKEKDPERKPS